jgi:enoyl-CoA hydratase
MNKPDSTPSPTTLTIEQADRHAIVTINRGDGRNALSFELMEQLRDTALAIGRNPDLIAVILRGEGAFSAGADLSAFSSMAGAAPPSKLQLRELLKLGPAMCQAWEDLEAVTIAAIEGYCVGGAAALAAALDLRIVGRSAFFRLPEVPLGINMSWHTVPRLVAQIGPARTKQYVMFGKRIPAPTALDWGLCEEVVDDGQTLAAARQQVAELLELPPMPVRMTKQTVNACATALNRLASHMDRDQYLLTALSEDFQEALSAFAQKRKPRFKGN